MLTKEARLKGLTPKIISCPLFEQQKQRNIIIITDNIVRTKPETTLHRRLTAVQSVLADGQKGGLATDACELLLLAVTQS